MSLARNKDRLAPRSRGDHPKIGSPTRTRSRRRQQGSHLQTKAKSLRKQTLAHRHGGRLPQTLLQTSHPNQRKEKAAAKTAARARIDARMCRPLDTNLDFSDEEARVGWSASVPQIRS